VKANPQSHLYMDISYFSEVFKAPGQQCYVARQLQDWIRDFDSDVRHLIYGTDWIMLEREPDYPDYGTKVVQFLKDRCHLTDAQLDRVMWQNAMRYLGLDSGKTRQRLLDFYKGRQPAWTRMDVT
jgi:hypothetical protein